MSLNSYSIHEKLVDERDEYIRNLLESNRFLGQLGIATNSVDRASIERVVSQLRIYDVFISIFYSYELCPTLTDEQIAFCLQSTDLASDLESCFASVPQDLFLDEPLDNEYLSLVSSAISETVVALMQDAALENDSHVVDNSVERPEEDAFMHITDKYPERIFSYIVSYQPVLDSNGELALRVSLVDDMVADGDGYGSVVAQKDFSNEEDAVDYLRLVCVARDYLVGKNPMDEVFKADLPGFRISHVSDESTPFSSIVGYSPASYVGSTYNFGSDVQAFYEVYIDEQTGLFNVEVRGGQERTSELLEINSFENVDEALSALRGYIEWYAPNIKGQIESAAMDKLYEIGIPGFTVDMDSSEKESYVWAVVGCPGLPDYRVAVSYDFLANEYVVDSYLMANNENDQTLRFREPQDVVEECSCWVQNYEISLTDGFWCSSPLDDIKRKLLCDKDDIRYFRVDASNLPFITPTLDAECVLYYVSEKPDKNTSGEDPKYHICVSDGDQDRVANVIKLARYDIGKLEHSPFIPTKSMEEMQQAFEIEPGMIHFDANDIDVHACMISIALETSFNCDRKFGLDLHSIDGAWLNLFVDYNPFEDTLSFTCVVSADNYEGDFIYIPTDNEATAIKDMISKEIQRAEHMSPEDLCRSFITPTRDLIEQGYKAGLVKVVDVCDVVDEFGNNVAFTDAHEPVCQIGGGWFYFAGFSGQDTCSNEYLNDVPEKDVINEIYEAILGLAEDCVTNGDEVIYYNVYLSEHLDRDVPSREEKIETQADFISRLKEPVADRRDGKEPHPVKRNDGR